MKWTIHELNRFKQKKTFTFEETVDVSDLAKKDPQIRSISTVLVQGRGDFSHHQVTFHLHIRGEVILPCAITLEDVPYPLSIDTMETFLFNPEYDGYENDDVHVMQGDVLDLLPVIEECILLELPMRVVSQNAMKNREQSGEGWEMLTEEANQNRIDPRLADLAKFFENK